MNSLEKLTEQNKENYKIYLDRMEKNCFTTTKKLIPLYTKGCRKILDVGCANGALIEKIQKENPSAQVIGIDLNENAVIKARAKGLQVYHNSLEDKEVINYIEKYGKFDCIIFSSVLHEVSSYSDTYRYQAFPVTKILAYANHSLSFGGRLIIRDGLEDKNWTWGGSCNLSFINTDDIKWFYRFIKETNFNYNYRYTTNKNSIVCNEKLAQEFLSTYTWGESSWHREIKEKFCIFSEEKWAYIINNSGFHIQSFSKSKEEYEQYLTPKVEITDSRGDNCFPFMTCMFVGTKVKETEV